MLDDNTAGWARSLITWLDRQGGFTQAVLAGFVLAVGGLLWAAIWRLSRWSLLRWNDSVRRAKERRERLEPKALMGLLDAHVIEPVAVREFLAGMDRLNTSRDAFVDIMAQWPQELTAAHRAGRLRDAVRAHAQQLTTYSAQLSGDVATLDSARRRVHDAWSSRMYWHDRRGSAVDILGSQSLITEDLLNTISRATKKAQEALESTELHLGGRTSEMDAALKSFRSSSETLIASQTEFECLCASILDFKKRRSGIRGMARRFRTSFTTSR